MPNSRDTKQRRCADDTKAYFTLPTATLRRLDRTIDRWVEAGILPVPMRINKIRYWDETEIERLERERMARAVAGMEAA